MSTLLDEASLVLIPSGYKEDVVYSQIPTDGAGDLSFTRASNGTRINSAGLVEVCPWNLVQNSEQYNAGTWTLAYLSISTNSGIAPNGTTTADLLYPSSSQAYCYASTTSISVVAGQIYTQSVYFKSSGFRWGIVDNMAGSPGAWFDLLNGVVGNVTSGCTASIENIGNGWYRCSVSSVAQSGTNYADFRMSDANGGGAVTANGTDGLLAWGFQLNIGSTAKPYFPTTDRLNVPRLTYQNGGGGCPSLLLEKQSTNLNPYSEDWSTGWSGANRALTTNDTTSPDGTQNADKLGATGGTAYYAKVITSSTGTNAFSVFMKYGNRQTQQIYAYAGGSYFAQAVFDLQNGIVSSTIAGSAKIESYGNGWYRCTVIGTASATSVEIGIENIADNTYTYCWGAQLEASSYPTSYIPTTSSSATRVADACYKTGISSLIGQTEGVIFADFIWEGSTSGAADYPISIYGSSYSDFVGLNTYENTNSMYVYVGGSNVVAISGTTFVNGQRYKIAMAYKSNDFVYYMNGTQMGTDTSGSVPSSMANFQTVTPFGNKSTSQKYNELIFFPTRLTNDQLETLTGTFYVSYEEMAQALNYYYD